MEQIKKDLKTLGIDEDKLDTLTVKDARTAYHNTARKIHPDKTDQKDDEKVQKHTTEFKQVGSAYERILKYIIAKLQDQKNRELEPANEEDMFARDNFDKFNFPSENIGSFTVLVEDHLAELWQECLQEIYGEPRIVKVANTGTESDRIWKITYINNMEITLHFYNHNKPKDKKQSKILVQGGNQSLLCEFVFGELPKVYRMVTLKKKNMIPILRETKRKRITTPAKKRNIKYKPTLEELKCALCDFASTAKVKITRHMKSTHTEQGISGSSAAIQEEPTLKIKEEHCENKPIIKQMVEDMSICEIVEEEKLLIEDNESGKSEFTAENEKRFENHVKDEHEHDETSFMHSCISCKFNTNDYQLLREHIDRIHREQVEKVDEPREEILSAQVDGESQNIVEHVHTNHEEGASGELLCNICGKVFSTKLDVEWHNETEHAGNGSTKKTIIQCDQCEFSCEEVTKFITHLQSKHDGNPEMVPCKSCDFKTLSKQSLYDHIENEHIEYAMLASITAGQTNMHTNFEGFKGELCDVLNKIIKSQNKIIENQNKIIDDQIIIKQDLFILKNQQTKVSENISEVEDAVSKTTNAFSSQKLHEESGLTTERKPALFVPQPMKEKQSLKPSLPEVQIPTPRQKQYPKVCIIGDSISGNLDNKIIAKTMDADIRVERAYSSLEDVFENEAKEEIKFPHKSVQKVIEKEVENNETDILIVQSTSVDITNMKTSNDNIKKYSEYFKQETIISASNLFTAVENTLKSNPSIREAIIMKQIPRYDPISNDPQGVKPVLRQLYNDSLVQQWLNSPLKDKIKLGNHELECTGAVREARFRSGRKYDGIHLYGPSGRKAYTESVLMILRSAGLIKTPPPSYFHRYHDDKINNARQDKYYCPTQDTDYLNDRDIRVKNYQSRYQYSIPTTNRFSHLSQGNY